jgi:hypothetical protein
MSGKLISTLFIPYLIIAIMGVVSQNEYSSNPDAANNLANSMLDIRVSDVKAVGTSSYTGEENENILTSGFSFLTDATGTMFGFSKDLFSVLTLSYAWWSNCKKSTNEDPGYNSDGQLLPEGSGDCYIDSIGQIAKDAPLAYMLVRYLLIIMALPAIYVLLFKSAELFARFINAAGSAFASTFQFLKGV